MNNLFISIGDLLGPIVGGFLSSHFGFKFCCLTIFIIFVLIYILFLCYYNKGNNDNNIEMINLMKSLNDELYK